MPGGISVREAIRKWEQKNGIAPNEAIDVNLTCFLPQPIDRLDESINTLLMVEKLSLATNEIERLVPLPKLTNLKILSLGRNLIKSLKHIDNLAGSLEQLWLSYNQIDRLDALMGLQKLQTLLISNNKIKNWNEIGKLQSCQSLKIVMLVGNPIYTAPKTPDNWPMVVRQNPQFESIDGVMVTAEVRQEAENIQEV